MRNLKILTLAVALSFIASTAEAGPLRNAVKRVFGKGKAVAKKVVAPVARCRALGARCRALGACGVAQGANVGSCANGQCSK